MEPGETGGTLQRASTWKSGIKTLFLSQALLCGFQQAHSLSGPQLPLYFWGWPFLHLVSFVSP